MAVTIEASPEQVWPWLVQPGWGRGGCHSAVHERNSSAPIVADLAALDELEIRSSSSSAKDRAWRLASCSGLTAGRCQKNQ